MSVLRGSVYVAELVADSDLSAATVTCTVTAPDGTATPATPTKSGSTASVPIQAATVGTYLVLWSVSGAVVGAQQDQFTVVAPTLDLISLPDLKEELNFDPDDTSKDPKLRRWLKAATHVVEHVTGPIRAEARTDLFDGGGTQVILHAQWVSSITSVTEGWGSLARTLTEQTAGGFTDMYGYSWDRNTNILTRRSTAGTAARFTGGAQAVSVAYVAGLSTIPDDIQLATVELIRHWYRKDEVAYAPQGPSGPFGGDDGGGMMVGNYMVPNAVMELLTPWRRLPGFA